MKQIAKVRMTVTTAPVEIWFNGRVLEVLGGQESNEIDIWVEDDLDIRGREKRTIRMTLGDATTVPPHSEHVKTLITLIGPTHVFVSKSGVV